MERGKKNANQPALLVIFRGNLDEGDEGMEGGVWYIMLCKIRFCA